MKKTTLPLVVTILLVTCGSVLAAPRGLIDGKLAPCPSKPNCVVSYPFDNKHFIEKLTVAAKDKQEAKQKLIAVIESLPRTKILTDKNDYLHVMFTSGIMRFKDDVEFLVEDNNTIAVRSASRVGYSDLGANRKRVEKIRKRLAGES